MTSAEKSYSNHPVNPVVFCRRDRLSFHRISCFAFAAILLRHGHFGLLLPIFSSDLVGPLFGCRLVRRALLPGSTCRVEQLPILARREIAEKKRVSPFDTEHPFGRSPSRMESVGMERRRGFSSGVSGNRGPTARPAKGGNARAISSRAVRREQLGRQLP